MSKRSTQSAQSKKYEALRNIPQHQAGERIATILNNFSYGYNYRTFFEMFLEAMHLYLDEIPHYVGRFITAVEAARADGRKATIEEIAVSSDEGLARWREKGLHELKPDQYDAFCQCMLILFDQTMDPEGLSYYDVIGRVYMSQMEGARWNQDEFYTPDAVADCMARMSLCDADIEGRFLREARRIFDNDADIQERFKAVLEAEPLWSAPSPYDALAEIDPGFADYIKFMRMVLHGDQIQEATHERFLTEVLALVLPKMNQFRINDPCVGSGVLLLAAARHCPRWLIDIGYIHFSGQDIRHVPVQMARLNLRLYGITPLGITPAQALSLIEIYKLAQPYQAVYKQARTPEIVGGGVSPAEAEAFARGIEQSTRPRLEVKPGEPIGEKVDKETIAHAVKQRSRKGNPKGGQGSLFDL